MFEILKDDPPIYQVANHFTLDEPTSLIISGKDYCKTIVGDFKITMVEPTWGKDNVGKRICTNAADLVPNRIVIIPNMLTIYLNEEENNRLSRHSPYTSIDDLNPSENCVFVYAYNRSGKLINPLYNASKGTNQDDPSRKCPYKISIFDSHRNEGVKTQPVLSRSDFYKKVEIEDYNKSSPNRNPPNAIMFKPQKAGRYSFKICAWLDEEIAENQDITQYQGSVEADFEINAINGFNKINELYVNPSKSGKIVQDNGTAKILLGVGESLELRFIGKKYHQIWNEETHTLVTDNKIYLPVPNMTYSLKYNDGDIPPLLLEVIDGNNSAIRITGLVATQKSAKLIISGYGDDWEFLITVLK